MVEDGVVRVHGNLVPGSIANQSLTITEGDINAEGEISVKSDRTDRIQSTHQ